MQSPLKAGAVGRHISGNAQRPHSVTPIFCHAVAGHSLGAGRAGCQALRRTQLLSRQARGCLRVQAINVSRPPSAPAGTAKLLVRFQAPFETAFGQHLVIVGSGPRLGSWDVARGVTLKWSDGHVWCAEMEALLGEVQGLEFKVVLVSKGADGLTTETEWETGDNRKLIIPAKDTPHGARRVVVLNCMWGKPTSHLEGQSNKPHKPVQSQAATHQGGPKMPAHLQPLPPIVAEPPKPTPWVRQAPPVVVEDFDLDWAARLASTPVRYAPGAAPAEASAAAAAAAAAGRAVAGRAVAGQAAAPAAAQQQHLLQHQLHMQQQHLLQLELQQQIQQQQMLQQQLQQLQQLEIQQQQVQQQVQQQWQPAAAVPPPAPVQPPQPQAWYFAEAAPTAAPGWHAVVAGQGQMVAWPPVQGQQLQPPPHIAFAPQGTPAPAPIPNVSGSSASSQGDRTWATHLLSTLHAPMPMMQQQQVHPPVMLQPQQPMLQPSPQQQMPLPAVAHGVTFNDWLGQQAPSGPVAAVAAQQPAVAHGAVTHLQPIAPQQQQGWTHVSAPTPARPQQTIDVAAAAPAAAPRQQQAAAAAPVRQYTQRYTSPAPRQPVAPPEPQPSPTPPSPAPTASLSPQVATRYPLIAGVASLGPGHGKQQKKPAPATGSISKASSTAPKPQALSPSPGSMAHQILERYASFGSTSASMGPLPASPQSPSSAASLVTAQATARTLFPTEPSVQQQQQPAAAAAPTPSRAAAGPARPTKSPASPPVLRRALAANTAQQVEAVTEQLRLLQGLQQLQTEELTALEQVRQQLRSQVQVALAAARVAQGSAAFAAERRAKTLQQELDNWQAEHEALSADMAKSQSRIDELEELLACLEQEHQQEEQRAAPPPAEASASGKAQEQQHGYLPATAMPAVTQAPQAQRQEEGDEYKSAADKPLVTSALSAAAAPPPLPPRELQGLSFHQLRHQQALQRAARASESADSHAMVPAVAGSR